MSMNRNLWFSKLRTHRNHVVCTREARIRWWKYSLTMEVASDTSDIGQREAAVHTLIMPTNGVLLDTTHPHEEPIVRLRATDAEFNRLQNVYLTEYFSSLQLFYGTGPCGGPCQCALISRCCSRVKCYRTSLPTNIQGPGWPGFSGSSQDVVAPIRKGHSGRRWPETTQRNPACILSRVMTCACNVVCR